MPIVEYTASLLVGAGIGEKITQFKERKIREAQEILLAELRSGRREDATFSLDEDALLHILSRYLKAAQEGAANKNLRLMAQIIRGSIDAGDINPDRCNYLQNIAAEMSEEEIRLVWLLHEESLDKETRKKINRVLCISNENNMHLVPDTYPTTEHLIAAITRLLRTGLIMRINRNGVTAYQTSPLFDELLALVNLQSFDFVN